MYTFLHATSLSSNSCLQDMFTCLRCARASRGLGPLSLLRLQLWASFGRLAATDGVSFGLCLRQLKRRFDASSGCHWSLAVIITGGLHLHRGQQLHHHHFIHWGDACAHHLVHLARFHGSGARVDLRTLRAPLEEQ